MKDRSTFWIAITTIGTLLITLLGIGITAAFGEVYFERPGLINIASIIGFIGLCATSMVSYRFYFFILPFIILGYPAAVNDFFPSVYLGSQYELGASIFPFFTHIDLFLLLGIIKKLIDQRGNFIFQSNSLILTVVLFFLLSTAINIFFAREIHLLGLLICGLFPARYILLIYLLISNHKISQFETPIINGIIFSIFFLFLESTINTYITSSDVLISGTLASNTFANITASVLVFVIYLNRLQFKINRIILLTFIVTCASIVLLTETRMAILAGLASFLVIQMLLFELRRTLLVILTCAILGMVIYNNIEVPDRYSIKYLLSKIEYNNLSLNLFEMFHIERTWETSSIYTRLKLYQTAINMFIENPIWGTGYGTFNYLKNSFGFDEHVLIDAHNGYLNTLCQMGVTSLPFLYFIYLYPIINIKKIESKTFLKYLFILNTTIAFADFSNAGIYKPSVFALLSLSTIIIQNLKKNPEDQRVEVSK